MFTPNRLWSNIAFAFSLCSCFGFAQQEKDFLTKPTPMWAAQIALHAQNWTQSNDCQWIENSFTALTIDSTGQPVAGLYSHCLDKQGNALHTVDRVVKLSSDSGRILSEYEWSDLSLHGRFGTIQLAALRDEQVLVAIGPYLKVLDRSLKEVASLDYSPEKIDDKDIWELTVAPSRDTVLLRHYSPRTGNHVSTLHWIATSEGLKEFETQQRFSFNLPIALAKKGIFHSPGGGIAPALLSQLTKQELTQQSIWLYNRETKQDTPVCVSCPFSPEATLPSGKIVGSWKGDYSTVGVFDTSGKELWRTHYGGGRDHGDHIYAATDADIFLLTFGYTKDRLLRAGHTLETAVLFDASTQRELFKVKADIPDYILGGVLEVSDVPRAAISSKGDAFAILARSRIKYFRTPQKLALPHKR